MIALCISTNGEGGQRGRSQKAKDRNREAAQQRIARLREKGFEQGKQALTVKRLIGEDKWDDLRAAVSAVPEG